MTHEVMLTDSGYEYWILNPNKDDIKRKSD